MKTPLVLDAETALQVELNGLKLIEASAGTGKTYTIANLYLRHILEGRAPSQILVVTFTKAATEELRGRIRLRLFQTLQGLLGKAGADDEFLAILLEQFRSLSTQQQHLRMDRLRSALANMNQAAISTIHSFCQRVLQDHALPSLQYFDNEILVEDSESWQSAIRDWWRRNTYSLAESEWLLFNRAIENYDTFSRQVEEVAKRRPAKYLPERPEPLNQLLQSISTLEPELIELSSNW